MHAHVAHMVGARIGIHHRLAEQDPRSGARCGKRHHPPSKKGAVDKRFRPAHGRLLASQARTRGDRDSNRRTRDRKGTNLWRRRPADAGRERSPQGAPRPRRERHPWPWCAVVDDAHDASRTPAASGFEVPHLREHTARVFAQPGQVTHVEWGASTSARDVATGDPGVGIHRAGEDGEGNARPHQRRSPSAPGAREAPRGGHGEQAGGAELKQPDAQAEVGVSVGFLVERQSMRARGERQGDERQERELHDDQRLAAADSSRAAPRPEKDVADHHAGDGQESGHGDLGEALLEVLRVGHGPPRAQVLVAHEERPRVGNDVDAEDGDHMPEHHAPGQRADARSCREQERRRRVPLGAVRKRHPRHVPRSVQVVPVPEAGEDGKGHQQSRGRRQGPERQLQAIAAATSHAGERLTKLRVRRQEQGEEAGERDADHRPAEHAEDGAAHPCTDGVNRRSRGVGDTSGKRAQRVHGVASHVGQGARGDAACSHHGQHRQSDQARGKRRRQRPVAGVPGRRAGQPQRRRAQDELRCAWPTVPQAGDHARHQDRVGHQPPHARAGRAPGEQRHHDPERPDRLQRARRRAPLRAGWAHRTMHLDDRGSFHRSTSSTGFRPNVEGANGIPQPCVSRLYRRSPGSGAVTRV